MPIAARTARLLLILRLDASNDTIASSYLLPIREPAQEKRRILAITNPAFTPVCRYETLDASSRLFFGVEEGRTA